MSMKYLLVQINLLFLTTICVSGTDLHSEESLHRNRRQLLFPNVTLLQFNMGIGTPTPAKLVNLNWAFQANFNLPWNRTQIPLDILDANSGYTGLSKKKRDVHDENDIEQNDNNRDYDSDGKLYHLYKHIEGVLNGFGYNGTSCVLRALCQLGAEPLYTEDEEDLLHELATYVLNPKNDADPADYNHEVRLYIEAIERGERNEDCFAIYESCTVSILDLFTKRHDGS